MGFMKNAKVYLYIVAAAVALSACAKRDNDLAARRNGAGAPIVNGQQAANADAAAAAAGYNVDIMGIQTPVQSGGGLSVTSTVSVNSKNYQINTTHYQEGQVSSTTATFDGANFQVSGVCGSSTCSPYYLVIEITRNGQRIKQTAMRKYFYYTGANSNRDMAMSMGANEFMTIQDIINAFDQAVVE
jgi:hypothetical protein